MLPEITPFIFFTGKGGVGKTSLANATAVKLADEGQSILLISTDPASNLKEVLETDITEKIKPVKGVENLHAVNIDPEQSAEEYRQRVISPLEEILPGYEIEKIREELSGACTTEIAAFDEFARYVAGDGDDQPYDVIIFDTAPTGHTLLLLDTTGSYHREVIRNTNVDTDKLRTPYMYLKDPDYSKLLIVSLPETTPVSEAAKLQDDLKRSGIEPFGWIANQSMSAATVHDPLLKQRAAAEKPLLKKKRRSCQTTLCYSLDFAGSRFENNGARGQANRN
jgi:arsenite-transporting ATPase